MKKVLILILAVLVTALSACADQSPEGSSGNNGAGSKSVSHSLDPGDGNNADSAGVIEIKEKMFVAQINDIYVNVDDYIGMTIKYEGIFDVYHYEETDMTYYSVIRYGPGCCGTDLNAGFEVEWADGENAEYPSSNDWVEAVGVLEIYEENGLNYLRLKLKSLDVLSVRGEEYVYQ